MPAQVNGSTKSALCRHHPLTGSLAKQADCQRNVVRRDSLVNLIQPINLQRRPCWSRRSPARPGETCHGHHKSASRTCQNEPQGVMMPSPGSTLTAAERRGEKRRRRRLAASRATVSGGPVATTRPPAAPPSGPEIDDPVGRLDHVEVVLDHHDRCCPDRRACRARRAALRTSSKCSPVVGSSRM